VYGRKNRLKVAEDEEKEAQRLAAERRKSELVAREARVAVLKEDVAEAPGGAAGKAEVRAEQSLHSRSKLA